MSAIAKILGSERVSACSARRLAEQSSVSGEGAENYTRPVCAPQTRRAALLVEPAKFEIVETQTPQPGPAQLLVRLEGCGVCASNLPPWEGKPWFTYPMPPGALGHEGWGRIEQLGANVTGFSVGQRVAIISQNAYAQFDVADATAALSLPTELDDQPFPAEPLGCAMNVFKRSEISAGAHVAIIGIGFLGALLLQLATAAGAHVIAISRRRFALELAKRMGAQHVLELNDASTVAEQIRQITHDQFCGVVIEATGKQQPLDLAAQLTRVRGRLVIAGYHQDGARQVNMQLWNWRGLDVINAHERDPQVYIAGIRAAIHGVQNGFLDPRALYTHQFPLSQIDSAFQAAATRPDGFMKALVMMQ
jgi:threonine dehydrogenase-like Zn-dependent dehydrogenase